MQNKILFWLVLGMITQATAFAQDASPTATPDQPAEVTGKMKRQAGRDVDADWDSTKKDILAEMVAYQNANKNLDFLDFQLQKNVADQKAAQAALDAANHALANPNIKDKERTLATTQAKIQTDKLAQLKTDETSIRQQEADIQKTVVSDPTTFKDEFDSAKADKLERLNNQKDIPGRFKKRVQGDNFSSLVSDSNKQAASQLAGSHTDQEVQDLAKWRQKNPRSADSMPQKPVAHKVKVQPAVVADASPSATPAAEPAIDYAHLTPLQKACITDFHGEYKSNNDQPTCTQAGVTFGAKGIAMLAGYNVGHPAETGLINTWSKRMNQKCENSADLVNACMDLGQSLPEYKSSAGAVYKTAGGQMWNYPAQYDEKSGNCVYLGDHESQPAIMDAKAFCQGPLDKDGKKSALATALMYPFPKTEAEKKAEADAYVPSSQECKQAFTEAARLIMSKPGYSAIFKKMVGEAALKAAAATKGAGADQSLEDAANKLKSQIGDADFRKKLTDLYTQLGAPEDAKVIDSLMQKLKDFQSFDYLDRDLRKKHSNNTSRLKSDESSAIMFLLSQSPQTGVSDALKINVSDAAAVWAQNQLFNATGKPIGDAEANLQNFSTMVYHLNAGIKPGSAVAKAAKKGRTVASTTPVTDPVDPTGWAGVSSDEIIKRALTGNTGEDGAWEANFKTNKCFTTDAGTTCSAGMTSLGSSSLDGIKTAIASFAATKDVQGINKKYHVQPTITNGEMSFAITPAQ